MGLWRPWSLADLVDELRTGRTTAEAAHDRARERIAETETELRAWVTLDEARPGGDAGRGSTAGALGGAPLAVKDIIDVAGLPTRCGSALHADAPPAERDAAIVTAWRAAGAVPIGKTVTTEFAFFNPGPTANPADVARTPGGSSSGSAAAVASGQVPLALGSQTAGSLTRPAGYCGVAGMVLSRGSFESAGVVGLAPSFDSHGLLAARVRDAAVAWAALMRKPLPEVAAAPRLLLWSAAALGPVSDEMTEALERVVAALRTAGVAVDPLDEDGFVGDLAAAHPVLMGYEAVRERGAEYARKDRLSEPFRRLLDAGERTDDAEAAAIREALGRGGSRLADRLAGYDAIIGPAALGVAPLGLEATGDPLLSRPWQALGLPTVTVPGMRDGAGLPLGVQLVGAAESDARLLAAALRVEAELPAA